MSTEPSPGTLAYYADRMPAFLARLAKSPEEISRQRAKGWPDFHPEDYCHRCGHRNVRSWWVDSEVWNALFRTSDGDDWSDAWQGIICPQCFTSLAADHGVHGGSWQLSIDESTA